MRTAFAAKAAYKASSAASALEVERRDASASASKLRCDEGLGGKTQHLQWRVQSVHRGARRLRLETCSVWEKQAPFGEKHAPFLGNACSAFGMSWLRLVRNMLRFWETHAPLLG